MVSVNFQRVETLHRLQKQEEKNIGYYLVLLEVELKI